MRMMIIQQQSDEKTNFLKQLVNVVAYTIKKNIPVNIQLMIKGKETVKNLSLFFQALAEAAGNKEKYKYKEAIEKIKSGNYKDVTEKKKEEGEKPQGNASTSPTTTQPTPQQQQTLPQQQTPPQQQKPPQQENRPKSQQSTSPTTISPPSPTVNQEQRPTSIGTTSQTKPPTPSKEDRSTTPTSIEQKASVSRPSSSSNVSKPTTPNTNVGGLDDQQALNNYQEDPNMSQYSRPFSSFRYHFHFP